MPRLREADPDGLADAFCRNEWFERGWTLQELLAPSRVVFLNFWLEPIGHKVTTQKAKLGVVSAVGLSVNQWISQATGIPENVLWDTSQAETLSFEERQNWMKGRKTTRVEDMAVCQDRNLILVYLTDDNFAVLSARSVWCVPQPDLRRAGRSL